MELEKIKSIDDDDVSVMRIDPNGKDLIDFFR